MIRMERPECGGPATPVVIGLLGPGRPRPGAILVAAGERGVREIWMEAGPAVRGAARRRFEDRLAAAGDAPVPRGSAPARAAAILEEALAELEGFFRGELRAFGSPVDLEGKGSPFDAGVWSALRRIPYGETRSYGEVARSIGRSGAARAVGGACGRNPVPVIVPCHRVIGADGSLTGFGGGLGLKEILLALEAPAGGAASAARPDIRNPSRDHERLSR